MTTEENVRQEKNLMAKVAGNEPTGYIHKQDAASTKNPDPHNQFIIVMDLARGVKLDIAIDRANDMPNAFARKLDYAIGCIEAVIEAHRKGILHRDIKLENFIVDEASGKVKLVDWGLAVDAPELIYQGPAGYGSPGF